MVVSATPAASTRTIASTHAYMRAYPLSTRLNYRMHPNPDPSADVLTVAGSDGSWLGVAGILNPIPDPIPDPDPDPDPGPGPDPDPDPDPGPDRDPDLYKVLAHPALQPHIWGGKGVGSQGDGCAQLLCKTEDDVETVMRIVEKDLGSKSASQRVSESVE